MRPLEDVWAPHRETLWGAASGAGLKVLTGQGSAIDTTTPAGKLVFAIFAALAEFERHAALGMTLVMFTPNLGVNDVNERPETSSEAVMFTMSTRSTT